MAFIAGTTYHKMYTDMVNKKYTTTLDEALPEPKKPVARKLVEFNLKAKGFQPPKKYKTVPLTDQVYEHYKSIANANGEFMSFGTMYKLCVDELSGKKYAEFFQ